jgi:hypothetical protein
MPQCCGFALQYLKLQQKLRAAERQLKLRPGRDQQQQQQQPDAGEDVGAGAGSGSSKSAAAVASMKVAAASQSDVNNLHDGAPHHPAAAAPAHRGRQHLAAAAAATTTTTNSSSSSSWPALCAELEDEVGQLKALLAASRVELAAREDEVGGGGGLQGQPSLVGDVCHNKNEVWRSVDGCRW